jgi:serine/threonine-protein kinase
MEREPDHRVDIFALGVLLFEALTGERPTDPFRAPSEVRPELDPRYDAVVIRAMQNSPDNRYGSCADFLQALREVVTTPAPPPKGRLLVGAAGTGPVTGPVTGPITGGVASMPAVQMAEPSAPVPPVPEPGPSVVLPRKKSAPVMLWVVAVLSLVLVVAVAMVIIKKSGEDDPPPKQTKAPTAEELAGNASGSSVDRAGQAETPRERVERLAREHMEKLKRMEEEEAKKPKKKEGEGKNQDGEKPKGDKEQEKKKEEGESADD